MTYGGALRLDDPVVSRALVLEELLRTRSPFALVRAVELAEQTLSKNRFLDAYPAPATHWRK